MNRSDAPGRREAAGRSTVGDPARGRNPGDEALPGTPGTGEDICPECGGTGRIGGSDCANCGATGRVVRAIGGA